MAQLRVAPGGELVHVVFPMRAPGAWTVGAHAAIMAARRSFAGPPYELSVGATALTELPALALKVPSRVNTNALLSPLTELATACPPSLSSPLAHCVGCLACILSGHATTSTRRAPTTQRRGKLASTKPRAAWLLDWR